MTLFPPAAAPPCRRVPRRVTRGRLAGGLMLAGLVLPTVGCEQPVAPPVEPRVLPAEPTGPTPPPAKPEVPPAVPASTPAPEPKPEAVQPAQAVKASAATPSPGSSQTGRPDADSRPHGVRTVALPPVPNAPPSDAAALATLLSRPPIAPPVPAALLVPSGQGPADARCTEATRAAREGVLSALSVPRARLTDTAWVEPILKITELALVACRGEAAGPARTPAEPPAATQAATYWRATAFLLHGQYARAAVHYRRAAAMDGPYAWLGYSSALARIVDSCAADYRPALDAWRLAGLLEARGETEAAQRLYQQAAGAGCRPLARMAELRLR